MGCLCSSTLTTEVNTKEDEKKDMSWDNKEIATSKEYVIDNLHSETSTRHPGVINGQQVKIQNCKDCQIYLFDHIASATVVDCSNCRLFIGPVKTSTSLRNCTDCAIMVASMQFHASNCNNIDSYLCSSTKPIIESSSEMRFGCFQCYYPELEEQFNLAQLSAYNNYWADIIDSTPVHDDRNNFHLIPPDKDVKDIMPVVDNCAHEGVTTDRVHSVVPSTPADKMAPLDTLCVVTFFCDGLSHERARVFIREIETKHPECRLMQCREQAMEESTALTVFGTDKYNMIVKRGAVISLVYSGSNSCFICQRTLVEVSCGSTGLVAVSANNEIASHQVKAFFGTDAPRLAPSSSIRLRRS